MADKNIWNIEPSNEKMPIELLNEYATSFNERFKNKLIAEIKEKFVDEQLDPWAELEFTQKKEQQEKIRELRFDIVVPSLGKYRLGLIKLSYRISQGYPCMAENLMTDVMGKECSSSGELDEYIGQMLKTDEVRKSISVLLSQTA